MTDRKPLELGARVFGVGVMMLALVDLAWGNFDSGQAVPKWFPERAVLAYAAATFMLVAGAMVEWRRTAAWGALALAIYYTVFVTILMDARGILIHPTAFGNYSNPCYQLAVGMGALIVYATHARIDAAMAARLARAGRFVFGLCAVMFGLAHFFYMNLTAPLVPTWLPPNQEFWGYATGVFHIAGGLAIISGVQARLAAILLTVMYVAFTPLVHLHVLLVTHPLTQFNWSENALNIVLTGVAWIVADSLRNPTPSPGRAG